MNITSPLAFQLLFKDRNSSRFNLQKAAVFTQPELLRGDSPEPSAPQNNSGLEKGAPGIRQRGKIPTFRSKEVKGNTIPSLNPVEMGSVGVCQLQRSSLHLGHIGGESK